MTETNRKQWNQQHQALRKALEGSGEHQKAIELFLRQHAMVHSAVISQSGLWSLEDEVLNDVTEDIFRRIPPRSEHSIAWCIFHATRCEDVTMNLLVASSPQVLHQDNWVERMQATIQHTGNEMDDENMAKLSTAIDIETLREYRLAVGHRTREIVQQLQPEELKQKVDPARVQRLWDEEAVIKAAGYIVNYWSNRTIAGLLLMPATRHHFVHLNEALKLKQ